MSGRQRLLGHAAKAVDARSTRSKQKKVGASEIGVCRRRAGYSHHGHPVTDPDNVSGLPAVAGTWYHKGALEAMKREWGTLIETTVEDDWLRGHVDAIHLPNDWRVRAGLPERDDAPDEVEVEDLKTKRDAWMVSYVRNVGPKRSELFQSHLYADLLRKGKIGPDKTGRWKRHERALALAVDETPDHEGLPVSRIRLRYMPRTGEEDVEFPYEQDFDQDIADEAWGWVEQVTRSKSPDELPRDEDGPGLSTACDHCPFVTACWGAAGDNAPQTLLVVTNRDLAQTLAEYDDARTRERAAKRDKDLARAKLDGRDPAIYTDGEEVAFKLGWSGGNMGEAKIDQAELLARFEHMQELYRKAGLTPPDVPYTDPKPTAKSIGITRWEVPDPPCGKPVGEPVQLVTDKGTFWQDQPRGGWTRIDHDGTPDPKKVTAGQFAKLFPDYVDPRLPCVLKKGHSVKCVDHETFVDLTVEPDFGNGDLRDD